MPKWCKGANTENLYAVVQIQYIGAISYNPFLYAVLV